MPDDDWARRLADEAEPYRTPPPADEWSDCILSASLAGRTYKPPVQFVSGFLAPGLTVFASPPKVGKTWTIHEMVLSVATGGNAFGVLATTPTEVLCLFFEDGERRVVARERSLIGHDRGCGHITYVWADPDRPPWTMDRLARYLDQHPHCRLVVIDTAQRFRAMQALVASGQVYADDYAFFGELQRMAVSRGVCLVLLHHDRKPNGATGSLIDTVSGTRAIAGSADHLLYQSRDPETGITTLRVEGRDLDPRRLDFIRSPEGQLRATAPAVTDLVTRLDQQRRAREMRDAGQSFGAIAKAIGVGKATVVRWCSDN
ncbi:MAG: AAA family ATPase [Rhodospirillales bacterium]